MYRLACTLKCSTLCHIASSRRSAQQIQLLFQILPMDTLAIAKTLAQQHKSGIALEQRKIGEMPMLQDIQSCDASKVYS
jgi:hypothetical protein